MDVGRTTARKAVGNVRSVNVKGVISAFYPQPIGAILKHTDVGWSSSPVIR